MWHVIEANIFRVPLRTNLSSINLLYGSLAPASSASTWSPPCGVYHCLCCLTSWLVHCLWWILMCGSVISSNISVVFKAHSEEWRGSQSLHTQWNNTDLPRSCTWLLLMTYIHWALKVFFQSYLSQTCCKYYFFLFCYKNMQWLAYF